MTWTLRAGAAGLVVLTASACTSGGAPGSGKVVGQIDRAQQAQVEIALRDAAIAEEVQFTTDGSYAADIEVLKSRQGLQVPAEVTLTIVRGDSTSFCIEGKHQDFEQVFHTTNEAPAPAEGPCPPA